MTLECHDATADPEEISVVSVHLLRKLEPVDNNAGSNVGAKASKGLRLPTRPEMNSLGPSQYTREDIQWLLQPRREVLVLGNGLWKKHTRGSGGETHDKKQPTR
jgi:hypothetical protein